ncbi:amidohydrolase family protein [Spirosoma arcticum]
MKIIDAHLHLWDVDRLLYPWLATVLPINRSVHLSDYTLAVSGYEIDKLIFVQAECLPRQNWEEISFAEELASEDTRIQGIVGYLPLEQGVASLTADLERMQSNPLLKGVRRMTETEPGLCLTPDFLATVRRLPAYGLSLDLSIKPFQMEETIRLIDQCPDTLFVLDHLGKPAIKSGEFEPFRRDMTTLAKFPNVVAKVSGLLTEADWTSWKPDNLKPYLYHAIDSFGFARLLYGSDWPVVLLAGRLAHWLDTLQELLKDCTTSDLNQLFYHNAVRVYRLPS